ncbi:MULTISPECIES: FAD-binding oxidoreductase [Actinomycetes]|uniref:FAD-binding oxidoreductase n=2 Tax=Actinomycetota TaxID=201174 RepID=UPI0004C0AE12|nr:MULTISPECIES: FAD-binding oxidoreductase [Actinomycetes]
MTVTTPSSSSSFESSPLDRLIKTVTGPVLTPADSGFATEIAGFNLATTPVPALVVGARNAADVAAALQYAREVGLRVGVRATGHGPTTEGTDYLTITTGRMNQVVVDPVQRLARVGAGARWSDVVAHTAPYGLTGVVGSASAVGVVGYTLGGGLSPLGRAYGYAADHVRSLEVVTPDGNIRRVDAGAEPDLFWALRGGRDGLGVVTSIEFELVELNAVFGGGLFFAGSAAPAVLEAWRLWAPTLPEEAGTSVALLHLPPDPQLPPVLRGQCVVHLRFTYIGDPLVGADLLAAMRTVGPIVLDEVGQMPVAALDSVHRDPVGPMPAIDSSLGLSELPAPAVAAVIEHAGKQAKTALSIVEIRLMGGKLDHPQGVANSVTGRGCAFHVIAIAPAAGPLGHLAPAHTTAVTDALRPWSTGAVLNFAGGVRWAERSALWSPEDRARLAHVRSAYDPHGVMRVAP